MAKSKKKVKNLEMAVKQADFETLVELAAQHRSKKSQFSFCDDLKNYTECGISALIEQLLSHLLQFMERHLILNGAINWASSDPENCKIFGQLIQVSCDIALACIQCNFTLKSHVDLALFLQSIMLPMPVTLESIRNVIAQYCEKLFLTDIFDNCEYFLYNVVTYLFRKTLAKKALKADVKRIYAIRKIIEVVMQMKEAPQGELWELFKKCAISNTYLSILEGQKVIATVMVLDIDKISEIHNVMKDNLPRLNIITAAGYGRAYFEAWSYSIKSGKEDMKNVIELTCLQDYILTAIRCRSKPIMSLIRKVLGQFHLHKKEQEVSKMLYGLYQPLLWRFIKNPDGQYRANAAQLFLDIFPLEDPDTRVVSSDMELNDQLLIIRDLLVDDFPIVRVTTLIGICLSMSVNWEVFPEEMLKTFFRIIVNDLSRDSATSEVRLAVVKGLKCLLENPLSLQCLVAVLPKMTGLFHDISENVRVAFCQLLIRVKRISAIKYFDIVPTNHLFARLEEDCHAVKKSISNLLHNSYFPRHDDPKVWLGRCLEIIRSERLATRVFFSYASCFIGLEGSVKFMVQAARAVHFYVKTKNSSAHLDVELSNKENILSVSDYISSLEEAVGFSNLNIVSTVMDAIVVMWLSLKGDVLQEENKHFLKMLVGRISSPLADLCLYYKDTEAWESVFYLTSFLPHTDVPSLASLCFWKLKNLPHDATEDDFMTLLECLVNQRQCSELLNLIKEWIEIGLTDTYVPPSAKKRRKSRKSSEGVNHDQPKPYLANRMLDFMICHRSLQKAILMQPQILKEMLYFVDHIKRKLERFNARLINEAESDFLDLLMFNLLRLSTLLHNENKICSVQFVNEVVNWTDQTLLKYMAHVEDAKDNFTTLVFRICEGVCKILSDVTSVGLFDPNSRMYLAFFEKILQSGLAHKFIVIASRFLYKHAASSQILILLEDEKVMAQLLMDSLCKNFVTISNENLLKRINPTDMKEIKFALSSLMLVVYNHREKIEGPVAQVFKCILKNILDSLIIKTSKIVEELADNPFDRLSFPDVGAFFMSILDQKPKLILTWVKYLTEMFQNSNKDISMWIAYVMVVFNILSSKGLTKPAALETQVLFNLLEKYLHELYPRQNNSESSNSQEPEDCVLNQLFQRHCHEELIRLKSRLVTKLCTLKFQND